MLDPWIIEEILRREEDKRRREEEAGRVVEMPLESPHYRDNSRFPTENQDSDAGRGVIVLDI
jgi:hypothetical protein